MANNHIYISFLITLLVCICVVVFGDIHRFRSSQRKTLNPGDDLEILSRLKTESSGVELGAQDPIDFNTAAVEPNNKNAYVCAILSTILVGLTGVFPLLLPLDAVPRNVENGDKKLNLFLSFAVGGLLGDVFLHLLPEALAHIDPGDRNARIRYGLWVLLGIFVFLILEKVFGENEKEEEQSKKLKNNNQKDSVFHQNGKHSKQKNGKLPVTRNGVKNGVKNGYTLPSNGHSSGHHSNGYMKCGKAHENLGEKKLVSGYLNLLANFTDNFTHGLAVGGSFLVSTKVGVLTTGAILLHELPHEIGDFAILLRSGFNRWEAAKAQVITSVGGLLGATVALMSESPETAGTSSVWILPFTSGGFLNIAMVTVLPDLVKESDPRESVKQMMCLVLGLSVMAAVNVIAD